MKQLRLPILLTAVFFYNLCVGQSFYKPGFVVTSNGDSLQGWIDYRQWQKNPDAIKFRKDPVDKEQTYTTNDLLYFEITGIDRYERAVVNKDMRAVELDDLVKNENDTTVTDTVFLRILLQGKISLYLYEDSKAHYYIKEEGKDYQELFFKVYLEDNDTKFSTMYIFRDQIKQQIPSSKYTPGLSSLIERTRYEEKDLIKIIAKINSLSGEEVSYRFKESTRLTSWYIGAGTAYSNLKASGNHGELNALHYTGNFQPLFTAGVDVGVARNFQNIILRFELAWYSMKYEGVNSPTPQQVKLNYKLKVNNLAPSVSILYNVLNFPNNKFYVGCGAAYNLSTYPGKSLTKTYGDPPTIRKQLPYLDFEKAWINLFAKAGLLINKKIEIATAAKLGGTFSNYTNFALIPSILSAAVNYHF